MDFDDWWFHGQKDCPPPQDTNGGVKELPANGKVDIAMAGHKNRVNNKYKWVNGGHFLTSQTEPNYVFEKKASYFCQENCVLPKTPDATPGPNGGFHGWSERQPRKIDWKWTADDTDHNEPGTTVKNGWTGHELGNLHAFQRKAVAGCALGIAYKSTAADVQQKDFVIFSVVHDCPRNSLEWFPIPNLPACPNKKCICSWFWIHKSTSGDTQMYMTAFQCRVTNVLSDATDIDYARALPPRRCYNPTNCFFGPRLPMYWRNNEPGGRNNMPESGDRAPTYSIIYGFREGAQHDIFVNTNPRRRSTNIPPEQQCPGQRSRLNQNEELKSGEKLTSPDCNIVLTFETDGRLRIVEKNKKEDGSEGPEEELWSTSSLLSNSPFTLTISDRGELSIKDRTDEQRWGGKTLYSSQDWFPTSAGIEGGSSYHLDMTNYGHLVLYDGTGIDLWESPYTERFPIYFWPTEPDPPVWETMGIPANLNEARIFVPKRIFVPEGKACDWGLGKSQPGCSLCAKYKDGRSDGFWGQDCVYVQSENKCFPKSHAVATGNSFCAGSTWNFETGDLFGWSTTGEAFAFQPTFGDNSAERDKPSNLEGDYYVGTYEKYQGTGTIGSFQGDDKTGTMTSNVFTVSKSRISFLIGGGNDMDNLYVGLKVGDTVVLKSTGEDQEGMQPEEWDVSAYLDEEAQIVVVDTGTGDWAHINVDDFKFSDVSEFTEVEERTEGGLLTGKVSKLKSQILQRNGVQHSLVE